MVSLMRFNRAILVMCFAAIIVSCAGPRRITFTNPVDTKDKPIALQQKRVEFVPEMGIYISNDFPSARLNQLSVKNDSTLILRIQPENAPINNSAYFAFKTWATSNKVVNFQFEYPEGYKHRYVPKYQIARGPWVQADSLMFAVKDSIATLRFNISKDTALIAAQELQTTNNVKDWYTNISQKNSDVSRLKVVGKTHLGKDIPMMDIYKGTKDNKDIIVLLTRQHPPEVTGYLAFQSFLETVLESGELSDAFLEKYRVLAFPLMNPDGVDLGHWRHNAGGVDLNRDWSKYRQPEVYAVAHQIEQIIEEEEVRVLLGLDFHSTWHDVFYTNVERESTNLPNFVSDWFAQLEANIPDYEVNEKSAISTRPVSKGWFLKRFNAVGITYEIGDETPRDFITLKGKVSAYEMMKLLTEQQLK
ncbi:M14 family metallopeptidase [Flagellimonas pacifica]|uniref:Zinc carboxypeptidase n=1 Tax=Flagellimonas pacifica TaxID=1247520 RepID=A0A285MX80_9FLAO|nr:M14 family metallopeptidase [Allomuricauda parva]SNZ01157.1 Zinc carboxypeptidase [Allomuricauda parva]